MIKYLVNFCIHGELIYVVYEKNKKDLENWAKFSMGDIMINPNNARMIFDLETIYEEEFLEDDEVIYEN